jgi:hypothetical protein
MSGELGAFQRHTWPDDGGDVLEPYWPPPAGSQSNLHWRKPSPSLRVWTCPAASCRVGGSRWTVSLANTDGSVPSLDALSDDMVAAIEGAVEVHELVMHGILPGSDRLC